MAFTFSFILGGIGVEVLPRQFIRWMSIRLLVASTLRIKAFYPLVLVCPILFICVLGLIFSVVSLIRSL